MAVESVAPIGTGLVAVKIRYPDGTLHRIVLSARLATVDNVTFSARALAALHQLKLAPW